MSKGALACAAGLLLLASVSASTQSTLQPHCHRIAFAGEVIAGQSFAREIGDGLTFKLVPQNFGDAKTVLSGWHLELTPALQSGSPRRAQDFIYPVNPPLRFNPWQDIATSYEIAAERKLQHAISYAFVLTRQDYRRIEAAMIDVLWPYSARDPKHADERYLTILAALELGELRFVPLQVSTDRSGQDIRRLYFRVEVVAPDSFKFLPTFSDHRSACPSRRQ